MLQLSEDVAAPKMQKPEGNQDDPFGQYFNAPKRTGVEPEPNTAIEDSFVYDLESHIETNAHSLDKYTELLKTLKSQGKYKKFLTPPPGKVFRLINLTIHDFRKQFGIEEIVPNKINVIDKPGVLQDSRKSAQSWTYSFNKKVVDFVFRQNAFNESIDILVGFITDTSQGDFYLNWQEVVRNNTLKSYTLGILANEQEVISIGPVPYTKFFYFFQDRKQAKQELNLKRNKEQVAGLLREILDLQDKIESKVENILALRINHMKKVGEQDFDIKEQIDFVRKKVKVKLDESSNYLLPIKPGSMFTDIAGRSIPVGESMRYAISDLADAVSYLKDSVTFDSKLVHALDNELFRPLLVMGPKIDELYAKEKELMKKVSPGFWNSELLQKKAKRLVVETQELLELAKPEASENDPLGKYFDGENRDDVKPRENNTDTEESVIAAIKTHIVDNSSKSFERYTDLLLKLKKQGKYKPFLTPIPGRAYRLLWNVSAEKAAEILRLPINEIEADAGNAWYVSGGGILKPVYAQVQSWSYSLSDVVVDDLLDVGLRRGVGILLVADISKNNFILNWKNLATKAKSMGGAASYLKSEKEVVSVGPVKFIEAAYINLGPGGIREKDIKLSEPLVKLWAQSGRFGEDITVASREGDGAENVRYYFKNITRLLDSDRDYTNEIQYDIGRLVKYLSDKGNQQEIANAYIAAGFGPEEAKRYKNFVKLANACHKDLMNQKAMTKPSAYVKKLYQAFNEKLAKHKKK